MTLAQTRVIERRPTVPFNAGSLASELRKLYQSCDIKVHQGSREVALYFKS